MKGFIYLIEIAVAGILVAIVLSSLLTAHTVKTEWERSELVQVGNNLINTLKRSGEMEYIFNDSDVFDTIDDLKPGYIDYAIKVSGIPKDEIKVGTNDHGFTQSNLEDISINNRWIKFDISYINFMELEDYDLEQFDVIILKDFTQDEPMITDYATRHGLLGIGDVNLELFNLDSGTGSGNLYFKDYSRLEKYFKGIGFFVDVNPLVKIGYWKMWGQNTEVELITPNRIRVDENNYNVGDVIYLTGPDSNIYEFKVKKIVWASGVYIQPKDFVFDDFASDDNLRPKTGGVTLVGDTFAGATLTGNKMWISDFATEDEEYKTLMQAGVISLTDNWYIGEVKEEKFLVPTFVPLCCDIAETAEINFILWYVY